MSRLGVMLHPRFVELSNGETLGAAMNPHSSASIRRRLDSWKEIAGYLNVSVRTVQRWEALSQLPVHRIQRDRGAAVFAFSDEIDEWFRSRVQSPDEASARDSSGPPPPGRLSVPAAAPMRPGPRRGLFLGGVGFAGLAAMVLVWSRLQGPPGPLSSQLLTVERGAEWSPVLSPDGQKLLFVWCRGDEFGVAYQSPPGGKVQYLTRGPVMDYSPQWLPDSRSFVWLRFRGDFQAEIWMAAIDNPDGARAIATVDGVSWLDPIRFGPYVQVLPGGKAAIVAGQSGQRGPASLERVDLATGQRQRLRTDPRRICSIALSVDGTRLATVYQEGDRSILEGHRLTSDGRITSGPGTLPKSGSVTGVARGASRELLQLAFEGLRRPETPRRTQFSIGQAWWRRAIHLAERAPLAATFSFGTDRHLYWSDLRFDTSLRRWDSKRGQLSSPLCDSSTMERSASYAPDSKRVAFVSNRSGGTNIFACDLDRDEVTPLTRYPYSFTWRPKWSPDGRQIGYVVNEIGQPGRVETASSTGKGTPRNWTEGIVGGPEDFAWALDGRGLYLLTQSKIFHRVDPQSVPVLLAETTASRIQPRADGQFWLLDGDQLVLWDPRTGDRRIVDRSMADLAQLDRDGRSIFAARKTRPGPFGYELRRYTDQGAAVPIAPDVPSVMGWPGGPDGIYFAIIPEETEAAIYRAEPIR